MVKKYCKKIFGGSKRKRKYNIPNKVSKRKNRKKYEYEYGSPTNGAKLFVGGFAGGRFFRNSVIGGDSPFGRL